MKNKIIKSLTMGLSCLMLALTLSATVLNNIHTHQGSPYGISQSKNIIHTDQDSPSL